MGFAGRGAVNMWAVALFAQAGRADKDPFRQPEVIWGTAGLALALLAGALVIWLVDRWRKKTTVTTNSAEELTDFRGMLDRGEITEEEYAKLRTRVSGRVRQTPTAPTAMPGPAANSPAAPPAETPPQNPPPPA